MVVQEFRLPLLLTLVWYSTSTALSSCAIICRRGCKPENYISQKLLQLGFQRSLTFGQSDILCMRLRRWKWGERGATSIFSDKHSCGDLFFLVASLIAQCPVMWPPRELKGYGAAIFAHMSSRRHGRTSSSGSMVATESDCRKGRSSLDEPPLRCNSGNHSCHFNPKLLQHFQQLCKQFNIL